MSAETTSEILRRVRQIEIRTRRLVTEAVAGAYHSSFKGQGIDFEDVREYAVGDDVRSIDWNVTARTGRPFIKRFREERELTLMLMVDLSASGHFGSIEDSKRERAAELASVLAFSAVRNNDRVGLMLFTDDVELFIPPRKGRRHVLRVIREILFYQPRRKGTNVTGALETLNRLIHRRAVVFVLSDFLQGEEGILPQPDSIQELDTTFYRTLSLSNRRHDLIGIQLRDPREWMLPDVGLICLEDAENGEIVELDTRREANRKAYNREALKQQDKFIQGARKRGIDLLSISTEGRYIGQLRQFFEQRANRR